MTAPILIVITRQNRIERPSEAQLEASFAQMAQAAEANMLGSPEDYTTDNFIKTIPRRPRDTGIALEVERVMQARYDALQAKPDDGVSVYEYPYGGGSGRTELKSKVIPEYEDIDGTIMPETTITEELTVRTTEAVMEGYEGNNTTETIFDTMEEAKSYIEALNASDGYVLFGNFQNKTEVLETRPCLWDIPERVLALMQPVRHADRLNEEDRN